MEPDLHVDDATALARRLVRLLEEEADRAQGARGRFAVALPGGSVATTFFPSLAGARCDWARTQFFFGDERGVPPDDPASNAGLARALWLGPAAVPPLNVHPMPAAAGDARAYEREIRDAAGRLDLVLLGVGADGHVASLFPGHPLLQEREHRVATLDDAPKPPPRRMTLTLPALWEAELVVVAALGDAKAPVLREALGDPSSPLPVALALRGGRRALVLLDPAAAGSATRPG